jgi:mono/diheme cytochrome c family protein
VLVKRQSSDRSKRAVTAAVAVVLLTAGTIVPARLQTHVGAAPAQTPSVWQGVYTEQQATRGQQTFQSECASCHPPMSGSGAAIAPALSGSEFRQRWAEQSVGDIFMTMRTTMPPSAPASLSKEAYVDVLAYVLKANKYPAGSTELPPEPARLGLIVIDAQR